LLLFYFVVVENSTGLLVFRVNWFCKTSTN